MTNDASHCTEWTFQSETVAKIFRRLVTAGKPLRDAIDGRILYGIKTGLNEAFVIDHSTRQQLIKADASASALIRSLVTGRDLRPWYVEGPGQWLIVIPNGWTKATFGNLDTDSQAWSAVSRRHPSIASHLSPFEQKARERSDQGDYWWELRACDYYDSFDKPKILWPDIAKLPRYSIDHQGRFINDTGFLLPTDNWFLLALLQSRVLWFVTSQVNQPLRLRAGLWQYRLKTQFIERLPIPYASSSDQSTLADSAQSISNQSRLRNDLDFRVSTRISTDFARPDTSLNQKLTAWWTLDFPAFRDEVRKALKREIPVGERDEWAAWLGERRAEHERLTAEIVRLETELNERVYALFDLSAAEIAIIEESTKYKYGEV